MNLKDNKYAQYYLVQEMMGTVQAVAKFNPSVAAPVVKAAKAKGHLLHTGEGSSRIMPAKNAIRKALAWGVKEFIHTDGATQSAEYKLDDYAVVLSSNSGRTKETLLLAKALKAAGNGENGDEGDEPGSGQSGNQDNDSQKGDKES